MNKYMIIWRETSPNSKEQRLFLNLDNRDDIQGAVAKHVKLDYDAVDILSSRQINSDLIPTETKNEVKPSIVEKAKSYLEGKII